MEDEKTLYELLKEGVEVGDIVDAIEDGKVRIIDRFGRDNQIPKGKDLDDLLNQLELHLNMIAWKRVPEEHSPYDTRTYWQYDWPFMEDYMPGDPPPILRAWLIDTHKAIASEVIRTDERSAHGNKLSDARWGEHRVLLTTVREMANPIIKRGNLLHSEIAQELHQRQEFKALSCAVMNRQVAAECYELGRKDLIKGLPKSN